MPAGRPATFGTKDGGAAPADGEVSSGMVAQISDHVGEPDEGERAAAGAAMSLIPAVGATGVLVLLMSACSADGLRKVAAAWKGPVLVVGSAAEARAVIGGDSPAAGVDERPDASERCGCPLLLDGDRQLVSDGVAEVPLTPLEFTFLSVLHARPGRLQSFDQLVREVWGSSHVGDAAQVHSVVKRLRRKLEGMTAQVRLQAVRGRGFRLVVGTQGENQIAHVDHGSPTSDR